jgi:hypothetical protein
MLYRLYNEAFTSSASENAHETQQAQLLNCDPIITLLILLHIVLQRVRMKALLILILSKHATVIEQRNRAYT